MCGCAVTVRSSREPRFCAVIVRCFRGVSCRVIRERPLAFCRGSGAFPTRTVHSGGYPSLRVTGDSGALLLIGNEDSLFSGADRPHTTRYGAGFTIAIPIVGTPVLREPDFSELLADDHRHPPPRESHTGSSESHLSILRNLLE